MRDASSPSFTGSLAATATAVGAAAWADALRLGLPASPAAPAWEVASWAARDLVFLAPPILATFLLAWLAGSRSSLPNLAGWAAGLGVMALSEFSGKAGWIAGAILLGLLAARGAGKLVSGGGRRGRALPALVAALVLWLPAWILPALPPAEVPSRPPSAPGSPPSVVFVLIDTLRADHLGAYGYERPTSPEMDRLAASGVQFQRVSAPSSWTPPSMASIMTSTTVGQHGLVAKGDALPRETDELAGRLRDAGYRTAAFTTNPWLKPVFGFDDGFTTYFDLDRLGLPRRLLGVELKNWALERAGRIRLAPELVPEASEVTRRALRWMRANGDRPFFLWLHYMDVHSPYDPVEPWHGAFCRGHHFDLPDHLLEVEFRKGTYAGDGEVLEHILELYDEGILATDASMGVLARGIHDLGLDGSTLLVITSDHGEEFYDHGGLMHGQTLYQEVVDVPLIVVPPAPWKVAPARVGERVSTLDIYPTVLDLAGLAVPGGIAGRSLAGRLGDPDPAPEGPDRIVASQLFRKGFSWTALFLEDDKFIRRRRIVEGEAVAPAQAGEGEVITELYHLDRDPGEEANAAGDDPSAVESLTRILEGYEAAWGIPGIGGARGEETMDPETLRQLKALGYIN